MVVFSCTHHSEQKMSEINIKKCSNWHFFYWESRFNSQLEYWYTEKNMSAHVVFFPKFGWSLNQLSTTQFYLVGKSLKPGFSKHNNSQSKDFLSLQTCLKKLFLSLESLNFELEHTNVLLKAQILLNIFEYLSVEQYSYC